MRWRPAPRIPRCSTWSSPASSGSHSPPGASPTGPERPRPGCASIRRPLAAAPKTRNGLSIRYNEELDPNEGPGFGCFVTQAILFAIILLLIPVGLFTLGWPMWVLVALLVAAMILLFFVSMTSVFLLRVFFADRRRGRGRQTGVAKPQTRVIKTDDEQTDE